jgi:hypothetical protein
MRAVRANPQPPTVEEAQAAAGGVGRRHKPCSAAVEEAGASLPGRDVRCVGVEETGASHRAAWAADLRRAVRMTAWKTKLVRAALEFKQTGRSSRRRPNGL